jgi:hypothetical protein
VFAATVRGLDEDIVRGGHDGRVTQDGRAGPTEIAGTDDDPFRPVAIPDDEPDDRRAQDMAGIEEGGRYAGRHLPGLVVTDRPEVLERSFRVLDRVQRRVEIDLELRGLPPQVRLGIVWPCAGRAGFGFDARLDLLGGYRGDRGGSLDGSGRRTGRLDSDFLLRPARRGEGDRGLVVLGLLAVVGLDVSGMALLPAGLALGEFLVEVPRIEQDEPRKLDRARSRVDGPAEAGLDQQRQEPAMIEVGVGQDDRVKLGRFEAERDPVADRLIGAALEHPAIDQDPGLVRLDQEL